MLSEYLVADLLRVLGNVNAVPADLTSMMMRRLIWLIVLSFSFTFIVTAAAGPVVSVAVCAGVLIYALAVARGDAAHRAEAGRSRGSRSRVRSRGSGGRSSNCRSRGSDSGGPTTPARRGRFLTLSGP